MIEKLIWHNEKRKINDLIPYEKNPRQITEKQISDLKKSLEKFNLVEIPAIDIDNRIITGHQRLKILQLLKRGNEEIDVRIPNRKLIEEEFREYNLRSNKNTGEWDFDLLENFDKDLLLDVGFESEELIEMFGLNNAENVEVDMERLEVITVEAPEAPKLKERMAFYCENIKEYNRIKDFFSKGKNELDKNKLLEML